MALSPFCANRRETAEIDALLLHASLFTCHWVVAIQPSRQENSALALPAKSLSLSDTWGEANSLIYRGTPPLPSLSICVIAETSQTRIDGLLDSPSPT